MTLSRKTRLDQLEAEVIIRVRAERKAAVKAWVNWIHESTTPEECDSFWRGSLAGREFTLPAAQALAERVGELRPGDIEIYERMLAQTPPELSARLGAAWAVRLPGECVE